MATIHIESAGLKFPSVYELSTAPSGVKARFGVCTTFAELPEVLQSVIRCRWPGRVREFLSLSTPRRIRVFERGKRYQELADVMRIAEAANVTRDSLLRDVPATIEAEWVTIEQHATDRLPRIFEKLAPISITISVDDLIFPE